VYETRHVSLTRESTKWIFRLRVSLKDDVTLVDEHEVVVLESLARDEFVVGFHDFLESDVR
jgi:hypothetical protein